MRVNKTNLSVIDNTGARIQPRIIIGDNAGYKSGDILDANAVIENAMQYGKYRILDTYDEEAEYDSLVLLIKDKSTGTISEYRNITRSEYIKLADELLEGKMIPTYEEFNNGLNNLVGKESGYIGASCEIEDGEVASRLIVFMSCYDGIIEIPIPLEEKEFAYENVEANIDEAVRIMYREFVSDHTGLYDSVVIYYLKDENLQLVDLEEYQSLIAGIEDNTISASFKDQFLKHEIEYDSDNDVLYATVVTPKVRPTDHKVTKTYLFVPYGAILVYTAVPVEEEVEQHYEQIWSAVPGERLNGKFYYLKSEDLHLLETEEYNELRDIINNNTSTFVDTGMGVKAMWYQEDPDYAGIMTAANDEEDVLHSFAFVPYNAI